MVGEGEWRDLWGVSEVGEGREGEEGEGGAEEREGGPGESGEGLEGPEDSREICSDWHEDPREQCDGRGDLSIPTSSDWVLGDRRTNASGERQQNSIMPYGNRPYHGDK